MLTGDIDCSQTLVQHVCKSATSTKNWSKWVFAVCIQDIEYAKTGLRSRIKSPILQHVIKNLLKHSQFCKPGELLSLNAVKLETVNFDLRLTTDILPNVGFFHSWMLTALNVN